MFDPHPDVCLQTVPVSVRDKIEIVMASSIEIPKRLPILLVTDNVLLPGSSMRIPVRSLRK